MPRTGCTKNKTQQNVSILCAIALRRRRRHHHFHRHSHHLSSSSTASIAMLPTCNAVPQNRNSTCCDIVTTKKHDDLKSDAIGRPPSLSRATRYCIDDARAPLPRAALHALPTRTPTCTIDGKVTISACSYLAPPGCKRQASFGSKSFTTKKKTR